jgi:FAD/FMN-containing dehydrogenase
MAGVRVPTDADLGLPPGTVVTDPDVLAPLAVDWTGRWVGQPAALVRPASADHTAAVLAWCSETGTPVVPIGGNTGLVAGTTAPPGSVLLSTARLLRLDPVDVDAGQVTAGAGVTLGALQRHVAATSAGWVFGVDLAARDSATVGGMVATNAGGIRVLRHGSMRAQVLGVEAALAGGSVVSHLGGLVKDNTGYDLAGLLCGSEGTLGVVTAARLRLVPDPLDRLVAVTLVDGWAEAVRLTGLLRRSVDGLDAVEAVDAVGLRLAVEHLGLAPLPGGGGVMVLAEWAGAGEPPPSLGDALDGLDVLVAVDAPGRARLWAHRERQAEAIARAGVPHKLDVTLPIGSLAAFTDDVRTEVAERWPSARLVLFGHLGDGNLHVNVVGPDPDDPSVDELVLRLVAAHQGSVSAEHGIGRAKATWLHLSRSPAELAAMRALKAALDPAGILNPGALLPPLAD